MASHDEASREAGREKVSAQLAEFFERDGKRTIGELIDTFGSRSFAILFVVLMALPALPLPTGAVSHVLEVVTMLLALELIIGRDEVWVPKRWQDKELKGVSGPRFSQMLLKRIRGIEKFSRPRGAGLLEHRLAGVVFGLLTFAFALTAFLAPPFSGLDTLPALGVVLMSLGFLLGDVAVAGAGVGIGTLGVVLVVGLGKAITKLF